jgi:hypothetical protein
MEIRGPPVLRFARIEAQPTFNQIDVAPLPAQKLAHCTPASYVRDRGEGSQVFGKVLHDRAILLRFKEALARILDVQHLDLGPRRDLSGTTAEPERPSQHRQLVHSGGPSALLEPLGLIGRYPVRRDDPCLGAGIEEFLQVSRGVLDPRQAFATVRRIVHFDHLEDFAERRPLNLWANRHANRRLTQPQF